MKRMANALAMMIFATAGLAACSIFERDSRGPASVEAMGLSSGALRLENVRTLMKNSIAYEGQLVTVRGDVKKKRGSRAFELESGGFINNEILVVMGPESTGPRVLALEDDQEVVVIGTVRHLSTVSYERDPSWGLDPEIQMELDDSRPVIIADQVIVE